jgi:hypothetical protein
MRSLGVSLAGVEVGVRWAARVLAALLVGLVLVVLVGEGFNPLRLKGLEPIQMVLFWAACIGMLIAWRWQVIGGALSLGGMILFFAVELAVTGGLPRAPFLYLMLLPGLLFLLSGFIGRRTSAG